MRSILGFSAISLFLPSVLLLGWAQAANSPSLASRARCLGLAYQHVLEADQVPAPSFGVGYEGTAQLTPTGWYEVRYEGADPPPHAPRRFKLMDVLGSGGSGTAWRILYETASGKRLGVLKGVEVGSGFSDLERNGYAGYRDAVAKGAAAARPRRLSNHVPVHGVVHLELESHGIRRTMTGYIGEKAGTSIGDAPAQFQLDPREASRRSPVIRRLGLLAHDLLEAIGQLAKEGYVHRDLKPDNIFVFGGNRNDLEELDSGAARLALIDMGILTRLGSEWGGPGGTPGYIDPSNAFNHFAHSQSDLYSIGALLAERLTGVVASSTEGLDTRYVEGSRGFKLPFLFKPAILKRLAKRDEELVAAGASAEELALFRSLSRIVEIALEPTKRERLHLARELGQGLLVLSPEGQVLGAGETLKQRIQAVNGAAVSH